MVGGIVLCCIVGAICCYCREKKTAPGVTNEPYARQPGNSLLESVMRHDIYEQSQANQYGQSQYGQSGAYDQTMANKYGESGAYDQSRA